MKTKLKQLFLQIFTTYIGWLFICLLLTFIFGSLSNNSTLIYKGKEWCSYAAYICLIYPFGLTIVSMYKGFKNWIKGD